MTRVELIQAVDEEIQKLQQVKLLLESPGRDRLHLAPALARLMGQRSTGLHRARGPRTLSDEGRRRIAEAQKRRWARVKGL